VAADELPIAALRASFLEAVDRAPVVVSSPTGSGKSTEIPRWCRAHAAPGRVLVVEPRRVACRTLAARVAELEGTRLGDAVGYVVRDDSTMSEATTIVFATPGIVLRDQALAEGAAVIVLDEFHERTLDVDLLLALLVRRRTSGLVIMSATLDGDRVATHVAGVHLSAEVRTFPVDIRYLARGDALPDPNDVPGRVKAAVEASTGDPGDILVFLPGKAEIEAVRRALEGGPYAVVPLHGGLSLDEQRRAFDRAPRRKVILATNVAETSVTIPGVGVVIDTGLVRQTRYHDGRGSLVLAPIADDAQRAGRAGRMAAGVCYRLWSAAAALAKSTLPEIHRESLVPLVMSAAAWGERPEDLRLLDTPKPYALEAARADLRAWGVLSTDGTITEGGRGVFALPLDPFLGRFLVEARAAGRLEDAIDLVAALAVGRPLFTGGPPPEGPRDDLRLAGCDVTALVRAVREGRPDVHNLSGFVLEEARRNRARLRKVHRLPAGAKSEAAAAEIDVAALVTLAMIADPRVAHVARPRGRDRAFSNGGTELELARESAVQNARDVEAVVVFDTRAFGVGRATRLLITCATPIKLAAMARAGVGEDRLASVQLEKGRVLATIERVLAERVIGVREESPTGDLAREAIARLFLRGSIFRGTVTLTRERLALRTIAAKLALRGHPAGVAWEDPLPTLEEWVARRVRELGVESGEDLAMLSAADLTMPELSYEVRSQLEREFPAVVSVGDATYHADYDLDRAQVTLRRVKGNRDTPPPLSYLPRFAGLRIVVDGPRGIAVVRERG
jgi:ATP-dependent helicase HrpB